MLVGIFTALLILEFAVRVFWPQPLPPVEGVFRFEPGDLGYRLNPDLEMSQTGPDGPAFTFSIITNSDGLRDDDITPKANDIFRILALGDSYTFGLGAAPDEAYPQVLEKQLNSSNNANWHYEVINAGVPGYSIRQERAYLERFGISFAPDLVIITMARNDVDSAAMNTPPMAVDANGYLITPERQAIGINEVPVAGLKIPRPFDLAVFLQLNSHLYRATARYVPALIVDVVQQHPSEAARALAPDLQAGVQSIMDDIQWADGFARSGKAQVIVIMIPDPSELLTGCRAPTSREPFRTLSNRLNAQGIPHLNTMPALCQHPDPASLRWPNDGHFRPEGYRLIGEAVDEFLRAERLVPPQLSLQP